MFYDPNNRPGNKLARSFNHWAWRSCFTLHEFGLHTLRRWLWNMIFEVSLRLNARMSWRQKAISEFKFFGIESNAVAAKNKTIETPFKVTTPPPATRTLDPLVSLLPKVAQQRAFGVSLSIRKIWHLRNCRTKTKKSEYLFRHIFIIAYPSTSMRSK